VAVPLLEEPVAEAAPVLLAVDVEAPVLVAAPAEAVAVVDEALLEVLLDCVAALTRAWSRAENRLNPSEPPSLP
jgi:hypothetical protein